jgi:hypothetical protein
VNRFNHELFRALLFIRDNWGYCGGSLGAQQNYIQVGCTEVLRRLNAYNTELWVKDPNKNRISIAFSIERNSGMNGGDLFDASAIGDLADPSRLPCCEFAR